MAPAVATASQQQGLVCRGRYRCIVRVGKEHRIRYVGGPGDGRRYSARGFREQGKAVD